MNYPLQFPTTIGPSDIEITAQSVTSISSSPFTFKQQVLSFPGQRWGADVSIPPCKNDLAEAWVSFLLALRGQEGTFTMGDPLNTLPRGSVTYAEVRGNLNMSGNTLLVDQGPPNEIGWFKAGDWFQLGDDTSPNLYKVLEDTDTNSSGQATLSIWPNLRRPALNNEVVKVENAKGLLRLSNPQVSWSINSANSYGINFQCVEAL